MGLLVSMYVSMYKQTLSVQKIERFKALVFRIVKLIISLHTGVHRLLSVLLNIYYKHC